MMDVISEAVVIEVYQETDKFTGDEAHSAVLGISKIQPNLLSFIVEFTQDSEPEVAELAIYLFYNVYSMFQKGVRKPMQQIAFETIVECYESNETLMEKLENTHEKFFERIASNQLLDQPFIMKYVVDAIFEEGEIELTEDDSGYLFLLIKTVVDAIVKTMND